MPAPFSRRHLLYLAGGAIASPLPLTRALLGQQPPNASTALPEAVYAYDKRATVALVKGDSRRKNVAEALVAIDEQLRPQLKKKNTSSSSRTTCLP